MPNILIFAMPMKNRVLIINPWIYDFAAYDYWMKPLGLMYLAACLQKNGLAVRFIDCLDDGAPELPRLGGPGFRRPVRKPGGHGKFLRERITPPPVLKNIGRPYHRYGIAPEVLAKILAASEAPGAVIVGSMMTYWYPGVFAAIRLVRDIFPGVPVLLGGVYATLCPEHAALNSGADHVLSGAGEGHLEFIVKDIMGMNLSYRPEADNLDALPFPAWELLNHADQLPLRTSRGCPYRCPYCASNLLNHGFARRDPLRVADEISFWTKTLGIMNYSFYDDALLVDPDELAIPLLREIIKRRLPVSFHCPNGLHLREITPGLADLLYQAGFRTLRFGLETADVYRQREWGGKVENIHFEQATAYLREAGYQPEEIAVYLLCGLPDQPAGEIADSIRYVKTHGARPILAEYSPIPGTTLWESACRSSPYPLREEPLFHNNSLLPCAHPSLSGAAYRDLKKLTRSDEDK